MSNLVYVVGLGPGNARFLTAQAQAALQAADVLCGYTVYIDLVRPLNPDKEVYSTGKRSTAAAGRWKQRRAAKRWHWSAPAMQVYTAWPAHCWNWRRATQPSRSRSYPG